MSLHVSRTNGVDATQEAAKRETEGDVVYLSNRLEGQDDHLDHLFCLFEQLQVATVEASRPDMDLLTFAESAYYFGVVLVKRPRPKPVEPEPSERNPPTSLWEHLNKRAKKRPREAAHYREPLGSPLHRKVRKVDVESPPSSSHSHLDESAGTWSSNSSVRSSSPPAYDIAQKDRGLDDNMTTSTFKFRAYEQLIGFDERYKELAGLRFEGPERQQEQQEAQEEQPQEQAVGLVYLTDANVLQYDPLHSRELNIGIIIDPKYRGKGYARQAITLVLRKAFQDAQCHRVQAILPDHVAKHRAICLFTQLRFIHEGMRRLAFFSPLENVFKDITYMGMLDTDWALRESNGVIANEAKQPAPQSVWDELFARHQRERDELLKWEDSVPMNESLILARAQMPTQRDFWWAEDAKEEKDTVIKGEDAFTVPRGTHAWDYAKVKRRAGSEVGSASEGYDSDAFSFPPSSDSEAKSVRSVSPSGYVSAASESSSSSSASAWDLREPSDSESDASALSTASFDDLDDTAMRELVRNH
ncbi:hypothetical protein LshimejAT787_0603230 [Lyophyllum shimeji]|uniref:N-acetyltransferase domain-containing protein n=1 Tax=Lyophyllum shimeji TaxID=47721 RepID=A0A9P3UQF1_LYOSH|nr:hypothetical protein LshimejAT787_0603230 [Lyophyllum shimeji]